MIGLEVVKSMKNRELNINCEIEWQDKEYVYQKVAVI